MKFADLPDGSRFRYREEYFAKLKQNVARGSAGVATLFPSEAEVEVLEEPLARGEAPCGREKESRGQRPFGADRR